MQRRASSWETFAHGSDIGVRGYGETVEEAFEAVAVALTAVVTDPDSGQPVTRATDTAEGRTLSTRFSDGRVISRVESVHPDPESRKD